jgi:hypothetical protein
MRMSATRTVAPSTDGCANDCPSGVCGKLDCGICSLLRETDRSINVDCCNKAVREVPDSEVMYGKT